MQTSKREMLWQILLVLLPLLTFWNLVSGQVIANDDSLHLFIPFLEFFRSGLAQGYIPLWDPFLLMGTNLAGFQNSPLFYPPNYLVYWLGPEHYIVWTCVLHMAWGNLGHYRLSRSWGMSSTAAFCVAIFLGFCGHLCVSLERYPIVQILSWMPWLIWLLERNFSGNRRALPLAALVLSCQLVCGYPQHVHLEGLCVLVLAILRWSRQVGWLSVLRDLVLMAGAALVVASPHLWCLHDYLASNIRSLADSSYYQVYPVNLREFFYGLVVTIPRAWCVSPVVTLLAVAGSRGKDRLRSACWTLIVLGLMLALVNATRFEVLAHIIPLYKSIRYRETYLYLMVLGLGWLAGLGVDRLLAWRPGLSRVMPIVALLAVLPGVDGQYTAYDLAAVRATPAFRSIPKTDQFYRVLVLPHLRSQYWNWGVFHGISNVGGYNGTSDLAVQKMLHQAEYGQPLTQETAQLTLGRNMIRIRVNPEAPILRNFALRYSLSNADSRHKVDVHQTRFATIARAFLPARVHQAEEAEALQQMSRADFDPQQDCYLPKIPSGLEGEHAFVACQVTELTSDHLRVEITPQPEARLMVLSEIYDAGWQAGGLQVLPVNLALRGVVVPAGTTRVDLVYRPRGLRYGLPLAALGLIGLAGWWWRLGR
jgi:hypothetical protein